MQSILSVHNLSLEEKKERLNITNSLYENLTDTKKALLSDEIIAIDMDIYSSIGILHILKKEIECLDSRLKE